MPKKITTKQPSYDFPTLGIIFALVIAFIAGDLIVGIPITFLFMLAGSFIGLAVLGVFAVISYLVIGKIVVLLLKKPSYEQFAQRLFVSVFILTFIGLYVVMILRPSSYAERVTDNPSGLTTQEEERIGVVKLKYLGTKVSTTTNQQTHLISYTVDMNFEAVTNTPGYYIINPSVTGYSKEEVFGGGYISNESPDRQKDWAMQRLQLEKGVSQKFTISESGQFRDDNGAKPNEQFLDVTFGASRYDMSDGKIVDSANAILESLDTPSMTGPAVIVSNSPNKDRTVLYKEVPVRYDVDSEVKE